MSKEIAAWLDSKDRNYAAGVSLYAAHPTAQRGLVTTFQHKETDYTREKLVYVLQKALAADQGGTTEALKKKGKAVAAPKKATKKAATPKKAAAQPVPPPPMGDASPLPTNPEEEEEEE